MTNAALSRPIGPLVRIPGKLTGPAICLVGAGVTAVVLALFGPWALFLPVYAGALFLAVFYPQRAALVLLLVGIAVEPGAIDFTRYVGDSLWQMPPGSENLVPFTTSPMELALYVAAASAVMRRPATGRLPLIAWGVPAVMALGFAYGMYKGGPSNLAYNEARGLVSGVAVFVLALHALPTDKTRLVKLVMWAQVVLAVTVLLRYFIVVRTGNLSVPIEFAFSHEGSLILGIGLLIGGLLVVRPGTCRRDQMAAGIYCALILAAMLVTGRRAATLVLLVGGLTMAVVLFRSRPKTVLLGGLLVATFGSAYLAAYWNQEYGATAQPARAIRSQIQPSARDDSSDAYRTIEKYNVIETIRTNRVFGVGFGRPFIQFQPLPDLTTYWPLQSYTPHQNVLWLWLKMGIPGISIVLGFALVVLQRCMARLRSGVFDDEWCVAALAFTGVLMFLIYSTVDLGFVGPRSLAPAAILAALALTLNQRPRVDR